MLVRCGTSACNDIIHPWLLSSTPSSLSKAKDSTEDLNQNSFFLDTHLVFSLYNMPEAPRLIPPFYHMTW